MRIDCVYEFSIRKYIARSSAIMNGRNSFQCYACICVLLKIALNLYVHDLVDKIMGLGWFVV